MVPFDIRWAINDVEKHCFEATLTGWPRHVLYTKSDDKEIAIRNSQQRAKDQKIKIYMYRSVAVVAHK